jgi:hypothetical protein
VAITPFNPESISSYLGLLSDVKPTDSSVTPGSVFIETDTFVSSLFDGTQWWRNVVAQGYAVIKITEISQGTTSYSYSTGARALFVEGIGGGGAGGSCATGATNAAGAGGGGGGAYSAAFLTGLPANPITVQVGAGGTPGAGGANPGGPGTDTQFGTAGLYLIAKGGLGGLAATVAVGPVIGGLGVAGGAAASGVGDMKADGNAGSTGLMLAAAQAVSGAGGSSVFGGGAPPRSTQSNGVTGGLYGGGGSGGCILSGGANTQGGAGGNGILRITELA